jgi:hypothetical protein
LITEANILSIWKKIHPIWEIYQKLISLLLLCCTALCGYTANLYSTGWTLGLSSIWDNFEQCEPSDYTMSLATQECTLLSLLVKFLCCRLWVSSPSFSITKEVVPITLTPKLCKDSCHITYHLILMLPIWWSVILPHWGINIHFSGFLWYQASLLIFCIYTLFDEVCILFFCPLLHCISWCVGICLDKALY